MARRSNTKSKSTNEEAVVTDTATEAATEVAQPDTEVEQPTAENTGEGTTENTEPEFDLSAFQAAVDEAVENKDVSTGDVAEAFIDKMNAAYRALEGVKPKNAAKKILTEGMTAAMKSNDLQTAKAFLMLQNNLTASGGGGSSAPKAPVDPTGAYVDLQVTLDLARALLPIPEGIDTTEAQVKSNEKYATLFPTAQEYLAWVQDESEDKPDEPDVDPIVKSAVKLSLGKAAKPGGRTVTARRTSDGTTYSGPRRDVMKHILNAFANEEPGTFLSVNEIRKVPSEEYGEDSPSAGAIYARLFPASGKKLNVPDSIRPEKRDGKSGAVKV